MEVSSNEMCCGCLFHFLSNLFDSELPVNKMQHIWCILFSCVTDKQCCQTHSIAAASWKLPFIWSINNNSQIVGRAMTGVNCYSKGIGPGQYSFRFMEPLDLSYGNLVVFTLILMQKRHDQQCWGLLHGRRRTSDWFKLIWKHWIVTE